MEKKIFGLCFLITSLLVIFFSLNSKGQIYEDIPRGPKFFEEQIPEFGTSRLFPEYQHFHNKYYLNNKIKLVQKYSTLKNEKERLAEEFHFNTMGFITKQISYANVYDNRDSNIYTNVYKYGNYFHDIQVDIKVNDSLIKKYYCYFSNHLLLDSVNVEYLGADLPYFLKYKLYYDSLNVLTKTTSLCYYSPNSPYNCVQPQVLELYHKTTFTATYKDSYTRYIKDYIYEIATAKLLLNDPDSLLLNVPICQAVLKQLDLDSCIIYFDSLRKEYIIYNKVNNYTVLFFFPNNYYYRPICIYMVDTTNSKIFKCIIQEHNFRNQSETAYNICIGNAKSSISYNLSKSDNKIIFVNYYDIYQKNAHYASAVTYSDNKIYSNIKYIYK